MTLPAPAQYHPSIMESGFSNERCRQLWSAMLLIAVADIRDQEYNSLDYLQSVEFFTATSGAWASWRVEVAEMLELHADDLKRLGRTEIAAREARDPPPIRVEPDAIPDQTIDPTPSDRIVPLRKAVHVPRPRCQPNAKAPGDWLKAFKRRA
jgi:hypothetical protein